MALHNFQWCTCRNGWTPLIWLLCMPTGQWSMAKGSIRVSTSHSHSVFWFLPLCPPCGHTICFHSVLSTIWGEAQLAGECAAHHPHCPDIWLCRKSLVSYSPGPSAVCRHGERGWPCKTRALLEGLGSCAFQNSWPQFITINMFLLHCTAHTCIQNTKTECHRTTVYYMGCALEISILLYIYF